MDVRGTVIQNSWAGRCFERNETCPTTCQTDPTNTFTEICYKSCNLPVTCSNSGEAINLVSGWNDPIQCEDGQNRLLGAHVHASDCVAWAIVYEIISISVRRTFTSAHKRIEGKKIPKSPNSRIPLADGFQQNFADMFIFRKWSIYLGLRDHSTLFSGAVTA